MNEAVNTPFFGKVFFILYIFFSLEIYRSFHDASGAAIRLERSGNFLRFAA
jgi:hypothetical protein